MPRVTHTGTHLVVITRPKEDAITMSQELNAQGVKSIIAPLLAIRFMGTAALLAKHLAARPQAIVATSRHAVVAFARLSKERNLELIVSGRATKQCAVDMGFAKVTQAGQTAQELIQHLRKAKYRRVLYIRGKEVTQDIAMLLTRCMVDSIVLYRAVAAKTLPATLKKSLRHSTISTVTFFSQRTAEIYLSLVRKERLQRQHANLTALCMSRAIAVKLRALPWHKCIIAKVPDQEAMVQCLLKDMV